MKVNFLILVILLYMPNSLLAKEYKINPGVKITSKNYNTYIDELKQLLPIGPFKLIVNGLKKEWISLPVVKFVKYTPPRGHAQFTAKNAGKFGIGKDNRIIGSWRGGVPFPFPETGAELAWNVFRRRENPEEFQSKVKWFLFDKSGKVERTFENYFFKKCYVGRTDIPPIPEIPGNNGLINWKECMLVIDPFDVKGFSQIRNHYEDITKDDDVFSYIPALRRIRRLTGSDLTDPLLGSDGCYDDFEGWHQKFDTRMSFRILGKKEFLVPRFYDKRLSSRSFVKGNLNCYGLEWVKKPLWILEVNMNDPEYIYSRRVFYVDAENRLYSIMYEEVYNQKGELFKSQYIINPFYYEPITNFATLLSSIYYNNQTGHSTTLCLDPMTDHLNKVFTPAKNYTFKGLLRLAR